MKVTILTITSLVVIGGGFFLLSIPSNEEKVTEISGIPTSIVVTTLEKMVTKKELSASTEIQIEASSTTRTGDIIKTSKFGRALIEGPKSHPTILDYSSELAIVNSEDEGNKTKFELFYGSLWARAKKTIEKGEYFEIETGNAVAVVRGTSFGLSFINNITSLVVESGSVLIYIKDQKTGEARPETEVIVNAGQKATIAVDSKIEIYPLSEEDKKSDLFKLKEKGEDGNQKHAEEIIKPKITETITPASAPKKEVPQTSSPNQNSQTNNSLIVSTSGITPQSISAGDNKTFVVLSGSGFNNVDQVAIKETPMPDLEIINDNSLRFHISRLTPDVYDIYLILDDKYILIKEKLTVTK